jgi:hypothetical protein
MSTERPSVAIGRIASQAEREGFMLSAEQRNVAARRIASGPEREGSR